MHEGLHGFELPKLKINLNNNQWRGTPWLWSTLVKKKKKNLRDFDLP